MQIGILGAGMVGRAIALDLSVNFNVTSFDISDDSLRQLREKNNKIRTVKMDLSDRTVLSDALKDFDFVVSAVPGFIGYEILKTIIQANKNVVDISFFPENALELDHLAKMHNVTAIVDCGVAPGMSNLILGYYDTQIKIEEFECLVGGLPKKRVKPFEYKAPFSPIDVIEEYTRPARYVENSNIITKPALSDAELLDFEKVGTLESFNTDGLRSILFTMSHIPNMKEKTLRYPGHIDFIIALKKAGFFDTENISVKGNKIKPMDFTAAVLLDSWKLKEEDEEFTLMKIIIRGKKDGQEIKIEYFLYDEFDQASKIASMSRTTGYTCNAALNLLIEKKFTEKGVFPPELIGKNEACFKFILDYLEARNVIYKKTVS